jgi:hypothetical protein
MYVIMMLICAGRFFVDRLSDRVNMSENGSVVEKVILTAIFAALALAVGGIIVAKVLAKAHSINLN